nr:DUF3387 domain-containing protein [Synechococcus sp. CCAP 1479/9]
MSEAVAVMIEKYAVCCILFHDLDWRSLMNGTHQYGISSLPAAQEHILAQGKERLLKSVTELSQEFALPVPNAEAIRFRDDVGIIQVVRVMLAKGVTGNSQSDEVVNLAIRQIISKAVVSDGLLDVFEGAGLKDPDISLLSDEFLAEVRGMPQRNLAEEQLQKLLKGEIKRNVLQARSFKELLEKALQRCRQRAIEAARVIEELIQLAKDLQAAASRGEALGLNDDEVAFYDAQGNNDSAVAVLCNNQLPVIPRELVATVKGRVTIDWTLRENVRAELRVAVKRILRKYGYPPDLQAKANDTVIEQAETLTEGWAVA